MRYISFLLLRNAPIGGVITATPLNIQSSPKLCWVISFNRDHRGVR